MNKTGVKWHWISALCLQRQTNYRVRNNALGFDHDYVLKVSSHKYTRVKDVAERIRNIPGVLDVTRGDSPIEAGMSSMSEIRDNENVVRYSFRYIPPEYPAFFKLELVEGRLPLPGETGVALVNESFVEALPSFGIGKSIVDARGAASQTRLIRLSSLLSLLIALIGVLGLVWFDTRYMRKEIAVPVAYAVCQRWMSQFAFRTDFPVWFFLGSLLVVVAITFVVATLQSWRAASANPAESLKNE